MVLSFIQNNRFPDVCDTRRLLGNSAGCYLFLNERDSDVAISVKWDDNTWHLPAHRLVLSSMSEVFRTMFDVDMIEKSRGKIIINDSSPLTVRQFLKYLYTGLLDFSTWMEAVDLLKIGHKYSVQTLVVLCESYLTTSLTFANVCQIFETAQTYSLGVLEKRSSNLILEAAFIITATEGFLNLKPKSLEFFIRSRYLIVENECTVLYTLRDWATISCSSKGIPLTRENILHEMEPFMKYVKWALIPDQLRTFIPNEIVDRYRRDLNSRRTNFHVAASLQYHINILKFVVELGAFYEDKTSDTVGLNCLKFGVDNHAFIAGFKIVGMFRFNSGFSMGPSSLTLGRDDSRSYTRFNLNSLPWAKGATVGDYVWRELTAYLPFPVRVDPFSTYIINLRYKSRPDPRMMASNRWPYTRLESGVIRSSLGNINFHCCSECYGITQLFILPAPPNRNVCNDFDS